MTGNITENKVQPEPQLIEIPHRTSRIVTGRRQITGRQYRQMLRRAWFAAGVEMGIIIVLSVSLYIAQAGPI